MKKLIAMVALLGSVAALSACAGSGTHAEDETLTQAPYAENRTVGADRSMRSAEPVFEKRQVK